MSPTKRIVTVAKSFPVLSETDDGVAPGVEPFDPISLEQWAKSPRSGCGARHAVRFILGLFAPNNRWSLGRFDVFQAMKGWDKANREVFLSWAERPWTR